MNVLIKRMETYLSDFKEIRQFQTYIYNARQANIQIYFTKENQRSGFPYTLKANIISKALTLGGGSWSVYGLQDQGFSNDVRESAGSFRVKLYGYNYDELSYWTEQLKEKLLLHRRIKEVTVNSEFSWWKDDYSEFYLDLDRLRMAKEHITATQLFAALRPVFGRDIYCGNVLFDSQTEQLKLSSVQGQRYDVWGLVNIPFLLMAVLINWLISLLSGRDSHLRKSLKKTSNTGFVCNMNISVLPNKEKTVEERLGRI